MALILPQYLQAELDYQSREQKIKDCMNVIQTLVARSIREDLEEIVHRKYPRMRERDIKAAWDSSLWKLADPEKPDMPKYLYMSREDFYDVDDVLGEMIQAYGLEPVWSESNDGWDQRPGRVTVLTEKKYKNRKDIVRFHERVDDRDLGILNWVQ